ncbi:cytochrome c oxidase subunit II [Roseibium sediminis]|uniref:cytochrome c oxidase subunit II n=1 Tax=Roseibium sediminis TaxID=1775174 RepID=UPI00123DB14E|nr:cytochrome c oxidase subunit II [Roseibium sediminis]
MSWIAMAIAFAGVAPAALAAENGMSPWQLGLQRSVSDVMDYIIWFEQFTLAIIVVVVLFVLALLIYVMVRFNAKSNPVPSKTSHNTAIEIVWTIAPILILVVIAVPSFRLLNKQLEIPEYEMTIKATGYQWYWGYEYTDENMNGLSFDAIMVGNSLDLEEDRIARQEVADERGVSLNEVPRLLANDYDLVVPVDTVVRLQIAAADVIHAFAMPSMGVKIDAIPGRLNETWFKARETGVFYGQCSELCGKDHAFMPISMRVVTKEQFAQWSEAAQDDIDVANEQLWAAVASEKKAASAASDAISVAAK